MFDAKTIRLAESLRPDLDFSVMGTEEFAILKIVENATGGGVEPIRTVYGFNIDYTNKTVTYLGDAVGMTPAYMDYTSGKFNYGSWRDAFFMPRPCMLRSNGTVAYYLDENDYTKRADGTASDVGDFSFDGNAMMEWGQKGKRIFYKQVNEANGTISVYIADEQVDPDYHCWSFYDANGNLKDHFYTPIYNGTLDANGKLRSISGKDYTNYCKGKTGAQEVTAAELNNVGTDKGWYTEVNADWVLMCHLLTLMGKSLNTSLTYGNGCCDQTSSETNMLTTGSMNNKGLFWGSNTGTYGVKVFGMENQWGNQHRRTAGLVLNNNKWYYKLTRNTNDGSTASDYNSNGKDYLTKNHTAPVANYVQEMFYTSDGAFYTKATNATVGNTMYQDYFNVNASGARYLARGGLCYYTSANCGAFYLYVPYVFSNASWAFGASLSYK